MLLIQHLFIFCLLYKTLIYRKVIKLAGVKGNRRVLYTQKVIKESLLELLNEKDIHKITVTDICKRADINRGTFYSHYKDAYDLLNSMENEFFDTAYSFVKDYSNEALLKVLYLIKDNKDLCKIIFCIQMDSRILNRIFFIADKIDVESMLNEKDKIYIDYLLKYSIGGVIAIIQNWLEAGLKEEPEFILDIINRFKHI